MTVGIVAVSHSLALAEAARDLALQMISGAEPALALAAGTPDGGFGTDAVAVADAIAAVDQGEGVLVLVDLGSAILSAEMALEFLPDPDADVRVVAAPFVEGLLAATVRAATGGSLAEVAQEARNALKPKIEQLAEPAEESGEDAAEKPADVTASAQVINPMGLHARPAAAIAQLLAPFHATVEIRFGAKKAPALSALAVAGLGAKGGDEIEILATGEDAEAAAAAVQDLIATGFGEVDAVDAGDAGVEGAAVDAGVEGAPEAQPETARSVQLGVSAGLVVGPVLRMPDPIQQPVSAAPLAPEQRDEEVRRLNHAIAVTVERLSAQSQAATGHTAEILAATAQLAADPLIATDSAGLITAEGLAAERAVWQVLQDVEQQYESAGGALAERATDVRDVRARIVAELTGQPLPQVPESQTPFVLVARDLAPADTAQLDPKTCLALVLGEGGPTSHTAILARTYGIAAVVNTAAFAVLQDGDEALVDGGSGAVVVNPSDAEKAGARTTPMLLTELEPFAGPGKLASGEAVQLLANVGGNKDVALAVERGAEGVGLFRTEFCFLGRHTAPTLEEQIAAYREVFAGFPGQKVVVRTLDAGSDKPLPFVTPAAGSEENPALGVRGLRTSWSHPEVLRTQLAAIAAAAKETGAKPWVMAPMVATVAEAAEFVQLAHEAGLNQESGAKLGVMIETPAAALLGAELCEHVDFVSLGTNDLTQYTMAADRMATQLAHLNSPWQPAVLRLIAGVGKGAAGKPIGVCGEAAADPLLAAVLVGLGVSSLSMTSTAIPLVGNALAEYSLASCQEAAEAALRATSPEQARAAAAVVLKAL